MFTQMARLAKTMAKDRSIGDDEILIAIDHLNRTIQAADNIGRTAPPDTLRVKRILEEVATRRKIVLR
jgi:hypothetical protein